MLRSIVKFWSGSAIWDKVITILVLLVIIGVLAAFGYFLSHPNLNEGFTEFYLLNLEKEAENYPRVIIAGQSQGIIIGIVNHENKNVDYNIEIIIDGAVNTKIGPFTLKDEEKLEQVVTFTPKKIGLNQEVKFLLFEGNNKDFSQELRLFIDVETAS